MSKQVLAGIALATVALYLWGMLYWGISPLPYSAWRQTADEAAARKALLDYFPVQGTYYVPGLQHDDETLDKLYESGPIAFVHLTSREGRSRHEMGILFKGLALDFAVVALIALLLKIAARPSYGGRVKLVVVAGLTAAVLVDVGDVVWWYLPWEWKLCQGFYTFSAWVVSGLVLARFIVPERAGP